MRSLRTEIQRPGNGPKLVRTPLSSTFCFRDVLIDVKRSGSRQAAVDVRLGTMESLIPA